MSRVLVLGGSRSGKSAHAESLVAGADDVVYLATSPPAGGDAEWAERVAAHRARRPAGWTTLETTAPSDLLRRGTVLVDSVTTWVAALMDQTGVWTGEPGASEIMANLFDADYLARRCAGDPLLAQLHDAVWSQGVERLRRAGENPARVALDAMGYRTADDAEAACRPR